MGKSLFIVVVILLALQTHSHKPKLFYLVGETYSNVILF